MNEQEFAEFQTLEQEKTALQQQRLKLHERITEIQKRQNFLHTQAKVRELLESDAEAASAVKVLQTLSPSGIENKTEFGHPTARKV